MSDIEVVDTLKPLGSIENNKGMIISLNMKATSFFGIGEPSKPKKIWLTPDMWSTAVPEDLSIEELRQLNAGIESGTIVIGKKWIPRITKIPGTKEKYAALISTLGRCEGKAKEPIVALVKKGDEGGYTALEILTYCLEQERKTRSRPLWLTFLQDAIDYYDGPVQLVQDSPDDPENYEVSIDPESMVVTQDSRGVKKDDLKIDVTNFINEQEPQKASEEELNKYLGNV